MWSFRGEGGFYGRVSTVNVGKFIASWADQVRRPPETTRGVGPKAQSSTLPVMTWAGQDMNDSRRLVVVVAQAAAQRCTVLYATGSIAQQNV